jgi:hypothetical protein
MLLLNNTVTVSETLDRSKLFIGCIKTQANIER